MPTHWNGDAVRAQVVAAAVLAVDECTHEAAQEAERAHWWVNRTSQLEDEVISEPARVRRTFVSGKFGSTRRRGFYGLFLELREPFLRPAADRVFPLLPARMRDHFQR